MKKALTSLTALLFTLTASPTWAAVVPVEKKVEQGEAPTVKDVNALNQETQAELAAKAFAMNSISEGGAANTSGRIFPPPPGLMKALHTLDRLEGKLVGLEGKLVRLVANGKDGHKVQKTLEKIAEVRVSIDALAHQYHLVRDGDGNWLIPQ